MEISDIRVRLVKDANDRLKAVCSVTLDGEFVVRDVKVVEGTSGLFVAMPSRKLSVPCPKCRTQNHLRSKYCNECGTKLPAARVPATEDGREKAHRDIAHPITAAFRQMLQGRVLDAYREESEAEEHTGLGSAGDELDRDATYDPEGEYDRPTSDVRRRDDDSGERVLGTEAAGSEGRERGHGRRRRRRRPSEGEARPTPRPAGRDAVVTPSDEEDDVSDARESSTSRFWMDEIEEEEEEKPVVEVDDKPRADEAAGSRWAREKRGWREPADAVDSADEEPVSERKDEPDEKPAPEREDEDDAAFGEGIL